MFGKKERVIAVMGPTGAGKSSFLQNLDPPQLCTEFKVGHGVESETSQVRPVNWVAKNGTKVELVDTPGFDDSRAGITDAEVLRMIADFLTNEWFKWKSSRLTGLVYVHRISDTRVGGSSQRNLRMFRKLCGNDSMKNVVIVTTMWDKVTPEEGEQREQELRSSDNVFKPLLDNGAVMMRHDRTPKSAADIINYLLGKSATTTQIALEMAKEGKALENTAAGMEFSREIEEIVKKHKQEMESLKAEMHRKMQREFAGEKQKMNREMAKLLMELDELKRGVPNDPPPVYKSTDNFPTPETKCIEHYSKLLGLIIKHKSTLASKHPGIASSVASYAIDFADAMDNSVEGAQHGSSTLESALASEDICLFQQFMRSDPHPKTFTQGTWTKAWHDTKTVASDIETILSKYDLKPGVVARVFKGDKAKRCNALNEILVSMKDVVTDMRTMVDWWIPVIGAIRYVGGTTSHQSGRVGFADSAITGVIHALNAYYEAYARCSQELRSAADGIL
ncbi:P-loop containing nucleoside triphosphate hydrolase protein [Scleroderma yunnanense]